VAPEFRVHEEHPGEVLEVALRSLVQVATKRTGTQVPLLLLVQRWTWRPAVSSLVVNQARR